MKNSTHSRELSFWAWGMGNGAWGRSYQCPMPQATGRLSLYRHLGMEFPVAFNEFTFDQIILVVFS
ncbi:MAG: hypothetical protein KME55_12205 [Nostoc indistinguendum CM1-VF10]|jgi:hypothetical protein|nr:hypothetical protein [Nostoc indistinguendum CM1-VF10]